MRKLLILTLTFFLLTTTASANLMVSLETNTKTPTEAEWTNIIQYVSGWVVVSTRSGKSLVDVVVKDEATMEALVAYLTTTGYAPFVLSATDPTGLELGRTRIQTGTLPDGMPIYSIQGTARKPVNFVRYRNLMPDVCNATNPTTGDCVSWRRPTKARPMHTFLGWAERGNLNEP